MKKTILWILAAVLCLTIALPAQASDDTLALDITPNPSVTEAFQLLFGLDQATTAEVLDQVMAGAFSLDASDPATAEAIAPALGRLTAITSQEMANYATEKNLSKQQVRNAYYRALANVLRAEIMVNPASETRYQNIQIILDLFLNGDGTDEVISETRRVIRQSMTPQHASTIASDYRLPAGFVEFVIMDDDWDNDDWTDDTAWITEGGYAGTDDYIATDDYLGTDNYDATDDYVNTIDYDNTPDNTPDVNTPDYNTPDYNTPDNNTPNSPDYDDTPKATAKPASTPKPASNTPDNNTPDSPDYDDTPKATAAPKTTSKTNTPDTPDYNTPDKNTPDSPDYDDSH